MAYERSIVTYFQDGTQLMEDYITVIAEDIRDSHYVVKDNDTLLSISAAKYGTHNNWDLIAKRNNIIDPFDLVTGTNLIIPNINGIR